jgi:amidase
MILDRLHVVAADKSIGEILVNMSEIAFLSASELADLIRKKEISSVELTQHYMDRIERLDAGINAVVVRDFEAARKTALAADKTLADGAKLGPLHGVPMTVKELYHVAGLPTTFGHPNLVNNVPDWDSDTVAAYREAGAVLLGKTNAPTGGADFQTYNEVYGTTNNPWDLKRIPGGSSGGSAAALAAGMTAIEAGSDIGGSIRNPAHFCGVYGHKPTWGIVSQRGHSPLPQPGPSTDLVVCGPLARSAEDLALLLEIASGPDDINRRGWRLDLPRPKKNRLSDFRVAIWPDDHNAPVDTEIADRIESLGETLASLGATVSDTARPDIDQRESHETYLHLLHSLMAAGVPPKARERNMRYAEATDPDDHSDTAIMSRGMVLSHSDWLGANGRREALRYAWDRFFFDWDILLCPQMATTAFLHDHTPLSRRTIEVNGQSQPYFQQIFWAGLASGPLLPSTVFPSGLSEAGLPIGVQAIGNAFDDYITIDFTRLLAEEIGGFQAPPALA